MTDKQTDRQTNMRGWQAGDVSFPMRRDESEARRRRRRRRRNMVDKEGGRRRNGGKL